MIKWIRGFAISSVLVASLTSSATAAPTAVSLLGQGLGSIVTQPPELFHTSANLGGPTLDQWKEIFRMLTASGLTAEFIKHAWGADLGEVPKMLAEKWDTIKPALHHARVLAGGFVTSRAFLVGAPTILMAFVAAGMLTVAVVEARFAAKELQGIEDMRKWQMEQALLYDLYGKRVKNQDWIRVPSFTDTADIIVTGPNAGEVSDQNFQNYLRAAGRARGNATPANIQRALQALKMIQMAASGTIDFD
jgi:hypothetical protein